MRFGRPIQRHTGRLSKVLDIQPLPEAGGKAAVRLCLPEEETAGVEHLQESFAVAHDQNEQRRQQRDQQNSPQFAAVNGLR